jgi:hypothetical protein
MKNIIENKYCPCGQTINVEHGAYKRTCRTDGMRFYKPEETNDHSCLFRCPTCSEPVEYSKLLELGELPIKIAPGDKMQNCGLTTECTLTGAPQAIGSSRYETALDVFKEYGAYVVKPYSDQVSFCQFCQKHLPERTGQ